MLFTSATFSYYPAMRSKWCQIAMMSLVLACQPQTHTEPASRSEKQEGPLFARVDLQRDYEPFGYVAHALGTIDDVVYTNSPEAFARSYEMGFRLFEVDLSLLGDGKIIAAHDGKEGDLGLQKPFFELTHEDVKGAKFAGKYGVMDAAALISLMEEYPDTYFILDSKAGRRGIPVERRVAIHLQILRRLVEVAGDRTDVLDRMIPHVGGPLDLPGLQAMYPFADYMFAVYRSNVFHSPDLSKEEISAFVKTQEIRALMMPARSFDANWAAELQREGVQVYVHTVSDEASVAPFRARGVGVYSDGYKPTGR